LFGSPGVFTTEGNVPWEGGRYDRKFALGGVGGGCGRGKIAEGESQKGMRQEKKKTKTKKRGGWWGGWKIFVGQEGWVN